MPPDALSFFTIDHGTASTSAALVAPYGGRFRLLTAATVPAGVDVQVLLGDLVARVQAADPDALSDPDAWPDWARLESATSEPPAAVCAAASERRLGTLEHALLDSGWRVAARLHAGHLDPVVATEACLDPRIRLILLGAGEPSTGEDRSGLAVVLPAVAAAVARRADVRVAASGAVDAEGLVPDDRLVRLPRADRRRDRPADTALTEELAALAAESSRPAERGVRTPDGRRSIREATASLASLLDRTVETVDIGHSAGSRTVASPEAVLAHAVRADAALVPDAAMAGDREVDTILRWSAVRGDAFGLRDRVRNLRLAPWRDASGDGARLRLAALRAALERLEAAGAERPRAPLFALGDDGGPARAPAALVVASGGALSVAPPPAAALALVDGLRRPGAVSLFHDHARVLAPIGTLPDESDRRRLFADLLDDAFLPLGSAIVASGVGPGRDPGRVRLSSPLLVTEQELVSGALRALDLPPGMAATAELETRDSVWLGVRTRHVALELVGGLAGVLLDTRDVPLRLPERGERRRSLIESWERPLWVGADA